VTVRAVVDTNVVVSGILSPGGKPAAVLRAAGVTFQLVWTPGIVAGCLRVLASPHIAKILAPARRQEYARQVVSGLAAGADMVAPEVLPKLRVVKVDPDDDLFLATALAGGAQVLVSGDRRHLLSMREYAGVRIIDAAAFLEELGFQKAH
jgi:uncharacterized protein